MTPHISWTVREHLIKWCDTHEDDDQITVSIRQLRGLLNSDHLLARFPVGDEKNPTTHVDIVVNFEGFTMRLFRKLWDRTLDHLQLMKRYMQEDRGGRLPDNDWWDCGPQ